MPTMPANNWVSSAGVRLHRRARTSPDATRSMAATAATTTTAVRREVITHALASELDLNVVQTRYRGHAAHVAEGATRDGYQLVLTLGGDGTVNEAVNGMLRASPPPGAGPPGAGPPGTVPAERPPGGASPAAAPLFAALPGGSANV